MGEVIELPNGVRVELPEGVDPETIRRALKRLEPQGGAPQAAVPAMPQAAAPAVPSGSGMSPDRVAQMRARAEAAKRGELRVPPDRLEAARRADAISMWNMMPWWERVAAVLNTARQGIPFVGTYGDEGIGYLAQRLTGDKEVGRQVTQRLRDEVDAYHAAHPILAPLTEIGGGAVGLGGLLGMLGRAGLLPKLLQTEKVLPYLMPSIKTGRGVLADALRGGILGSLFGFTEGTISGYGAGRTQEERAQKSREWGTGGLVTGFAGGLAIPLVAKAAGGVGRLIGRLNEGSGKVRGVTDPTAARLLKREMLASGIADQAVNPAAEVERRLPYQTSMAAEVSEGTKALLDAAMASSPRAANIGREAVEARVSQLRGKLDEAMARVFGDAKRLKQSFDNIRAETSGAIGEAYLRAYSTPIDYSSSWGRQIEADLARMPPRLLRRALKLAGEDARMRGYSWRQLKISIGDDGKITLSELPTVQEVDFIKRALQEIAEAGKDPHTGKMTPEAARAAALAKKLRDDLALAVPAYRKALDLASDRLALEDAARLGDRLLSRATRLEDVERWSRTATMAERRQLAASLHAAIQEKIGMIAAAASEPNQDAAELRKALRELNSPVTREKIKKALGPMNAKPLLDVLDEAKAALELRAAVARNSATAARQRAQREVEALQQQTADQILRDAASGAPIGAARRALEIAAGNAPLDKIGRTDRVWEQIANALAGKQGPEARALALNALYAALSDERVNALSRRFREGAADITALTAWLHEQEKRRRPKEGWTGAWAGGGR